MPALIIPFRRELHEGMSGTDVVAVKRALSRAGHMRWGQFTELYGAFAVNAVKSFQSASGLVTSGAYDQETHRKLLAAHRRIRPNEWAFDARAIWLMGQQQVQTSEEHARSMIRSAAFYAYAERESIVYSQHRPMTDMALPPNVPNDMDCSTLTTWCYHCAGLTDPNGFDYGGWGNTGSQRAHGRAISASELRHGDLIFYPSPWHVSVYVGDSRAISHGSSSGPKLHAWDYRPVAEIRTYL